MRRRKLAATAVAVRAASVFGEGMAVVCSLEGSFGSCNKEGKKNARAIRDLTRTIEYVTDDLWELDKAYYKMKSSSS